MSDDLTPAKRSKDTDPEKLKGWVRYLGILTAIGLAVLLLAVYLLPRRPAAIVGGLALLLTIGAGGQFVFHGATLISKALEGRRRTQFQVAVSLAAPIVFTLCLASYVVALPMETFWRMLTPWLLIPLGITAWVGWFGGSLLDREHPFRGYLIAATALFVLCWFWTHGMSSGESDPTDEGGGFYLDPERAAAARQSGRYVFTYVLYTSTLYAAMFLRGRLKPRDSQQDEAFRKLNEMLTPDTVEDIVSKMARYIVARNAAHGREADLPIPRIALDLAYLKAIRDCTDPKRLELLKASYITLDDYMLSDEDCAALDEWDKVVDHAADLSVEELARRLSTETMRKALDVRKRLTDAMHRRAETLDKIIKK